MRIVIVVFNSLTINIIKMKINYNLKSGYCGLSYYVTVKEITGRIIHCICPYSKCKSFDEAIRYYYKKYHSEKRTPISVQHQKISKYNLEALSLAS